MGKRKAGVTKNPSYASTMLDLPESEGQDNGELRDLEVGISAWKTLADDNWVYSLRPSFALDKLQDLQEWTDEQRMGSEILEGTVMQVVARDEFSFWAKTKRLGNAELTADYLALPISEAFSLSWPTMLDTVRALVDINEQSGSPSYNLMRPSANAGGTLRECSTRQRKALLANLGVEVETIPGHPERCPQGAIGVFHGDIKTENMVPLTDGSFRAVDWEQAAYHPLTAELGHPVARLLLVTPDTSLWPEILEQVVPDIVDLSQLNERKVLHAMFWSVVSDAIVEAERTPYEYEEYLSDGLTAIVGMYI